MRKARMRARAEARKLEARGKTAHASFTIRLEAGVRTKFDLLLDRLGLIVDLLANIDSHYMSTDEIRENIQGIEQLLAQWLDENRKGIKFETTQEGK